MRAGLDGHGRLEKGLDRVGTFERAYLFHVGVELPGGHDQQVAHAHLLEVLARCRGRQVREELEHRVVEAQLALGNRDADCDGREALAQ
jgi:hypothetical protein